MSKRIVIAAILGVIAILAVVGLIQYFRGIEADTPRYAGEPNTIAPAEDERGSQAEPR